MFNKKLHSLALLLIILTTACVHPVDIEGEGAVSSSSGERDCSIEQAPCNFNIGGAYNEVYTAVANEGSDFVGWTGCYEAAGAIELVEFQCTYSVPAIAVKANWFKTMAPLTANFRRTSDSVPVSGGAVKGPIAGANVTAYAVNPRNRNLRGAQLGYGITDANAKLEGLSIPTSHNGLVLIEYRFGNNSVDLVSGEKPIFPLLRTIVHSSDLANEDVFATIYTELVMRLAKKQADRQSPVYQGNADGTVSDAEFASALTLANQHVVQALGYGMAADTNLFMARPVMNAEASTFARQQRVLAYRSAIEVLSAIISDAAINEADNGRRTKSIHDVTDAIVADLMDGSIDGQLFTSNTGAVSQELLSYLSQLFSFVNPQAVLVPGTAVPVSELWRIFDDELEREGLASSESYAGLRQATAAYPARLVDTDLDGTTDIYDRFPTDPSEQRDSDGDGTGDNADGAPYDPTRIVKLPPVINSTGLIDLPVGQARNLYASYSSDHTSNEVNITWTVVSAPGSSALAGEVYIGQQSPFEADWPGEYQLRLVVQDPTGSANAVYSFNATNAAPVANIAPLVGVYSLANTIELDASSSTDPEGYDLTFAWQITGAPAGSSANLSADNGANSSFQADVGGEYVFQVTGTDPFGLSSSREVTAQVSPYRVERLPFNVVDAEYSDELQALLVVGDDSRLHIFDTNTFQTSSIALSRAGAAVSVQPDSAYAAVSHEGLVSYVNLSTYQVEQEYNVTSNSIDVVLPGNGYVYVFPRTDQWERIRTVELSTGVETTSGGNIYAGTLARLHPDGQKIYGANNGLSPSDIERYDISGGTAEVTRDSPYHGDFPMCGNLWMSEDGNRIFTACGYVFRSSDAQAQDMTANGRFEDTERVVSVSQYGDEVIALGGKRNWWESEESNQVTLLSYSNLQQTNRYRLPFYEAGGEAIELNNRLVFHVNDGATHVVIAQSDEEDGLPDNSFIAYIPSSLSVPNRAPTAVIEGVQQLDIGEQVDLSGTRSFDPDGDDISYTWSIVAAPNGSTATLTNTSTSSSAFVPDVKGEYTVSLVTSDGAMQGAAHQMTVTALDPQDRRLIAIDFSVQATDYSALLNKMVLASSSANELKLFDPSTEQIDTIALQYPGLAVDVSPDGRYAAVGHDFAVSYVDLQTQQLLETFSTSIDIVDIVLAGNGSAYLMPRTDQWTTVQQLNLSTGVQTQGSGSIYAGTVAELHGSGDYIYGADTGLSPSDIELYDIRNAAQPTVVGDSPYHGDYGMCGNLWLTTDSTRIITACGHTFNAAPQTDTDMQYRGRLGGWTGLVQDLTQSGSTLAVIALEQQYAYPPTDSHRFLHFHSAESLSRTGSLPLPVFDLDHGEFQSSGRFIHYNADGSVLSVVVQADQQSGLLNDHAIWTVRK